MAKKAKAKAAPKLAGLIVPLQTLAKLMGVTPARVHQLEREGIIVKLGRDQYDALDCLPRFIAYVREENKRNTKGEAAKKVHDVKAREIEIRIAKEEGRLIDLEDVEAVMSETYGAFRSEMDGLPAAFTRDLDQREKLERLIHGSFDRVRRRLDEAKADNFSGEDSSAVEAEETNA
jgi:phage terminase Nu1 subunit (DNA packaging protein)